MAFLETEKNVLKKGWKSRKPKLGLFRVGSVQIGGWISFFRAEMLTDRNLINQGLSKEHPCGKGGYRKIIFQACIKNIRIWCIWNTFKYICQFLKWPFLKETVNFFFFMWVLSLMQRIISKHKFYLHGLLTCTSLKR